MGIVNLITDVTVIIGESIQQSTFQPIYYLTLK